MEFFLQFKTENSNSFPTMQTVAVEHKEKPLFHHLNNLSYTATGYGSKLPTRYMVRFDSRWYRVYSVCFSNVSTEYVLIDGQKVITQIYN